TGAVIGCMFVERGLAGDAALGELNRLWQYSERSRSWGSVPETDEQVRFVRKWKARGLFAVGEFAAASGPVLGTGPAVGTAPVPHAAPVPGTAPPRAGLPTAGVATARGQAGPIPGVAIER